MVTFLAANAETIDAVYNHFCFLLRENICSLSDTNCTWDLTQCPRGWIMRNPVCVSTYYFLPVLRPPRWVPEADWLAPWRERLVPAQTGSEGRGRRWAPCALIGWRGASGREGRGGCGSAVSLARRSSPREVFCGVSCAGSRSSSRRAGEP